MGSMPYLYKRSCFIVNKQSGLNAYKCASRLGGMDMANRLKWRRKQLKLTQAQLAEKAGMTQQMIQQLEARKVLTTGKVVALAGALGVRPQWLESGEEPIQDGELGADDQKFLAAYHELPPEEKTAVQILVFRGRPRSSPTPAPPDQERRTG